MMDNQFFEMKKRVAKALESKNSLFRAELSIPVRLLDGSIDTLTFVLSYRNGEIIAYPLDWRSGASREVKNFPYDTQLIMLLKEEHRNALFAKIHGIIGVRYIILRTPKHWNVLEAIMPDRCYAPIQA